MKISNNQVNKTIKLLDIIDKHTLTKCHFKDLLRLVNDIQNTYFTKTPPNNEDFKLIMRQYGKIQRLLRIIDYIGYKLLDDMIKTTSLLNQFK